MCKAQTAWKEALAAEESLDGASASMEDHHAADTEEDDPHDDTDMDYGAVEEHVHTANVGEGVDKHHGWNEDENVEGLPDREVASTDLDCYCSGLQDGEDVPSKDDAEVGSYHDVVVNTVPNEDLEGRGTNEVGTFVVPCEEAVLVVAGNHHFHRRTVPSSGRRAYRVRKAAEFLHCRKSHARQALVSGFHSVPIRGSFQTLSEDPRTREAGHHHDIEVHVGEYWPGKDVDTAFPLQLLPEDADGDSGVRERVPLPNTPLQPCDPREISVGEASEAVFPRAWRLVLRQDWVLDAG
jgi:hypothetical protein